MTKERHSVFETNSSTMHSFALITKEDFDKWKDNNTLFVYMKYEGDWDILPSWDSSYICDYLEPDIKKECGNLEKQKLFTYDEVIAFIEAKDEWTEKQKKHYIDILNKYKDGDAPYFRYDEEGGAMHDLEELQWIGFYSYKLIDAFIKFNGTSCMRRFEKPIKKIRYNKKKYENMMAVGRYGYDG